jgi:colanic acid/amylovoran biosynthesis glycosyltransferase
VPLRIVLVVDLFPELSESFVSGEARELARGGQSVRVEARNRARTPDPGAAEGLDVVYACDDGRRARLTALAWLVARHPVRAVRDRRAVARWSREETPRPLRALAPVARRVARFGPDHVHAHFAAEAALDAMRIGALLGIPYSVATHGYDIFRTPLNLREKHERAAFAVTASDYSRSYLRERVGPAAAARIHRLVVGVDGQRFRRAAPHPEGRTVMSVARLVEKKGLADLIEATALLRDRGRAPERVTIVGDGPLRDELEQLVADRELTGVVELPGPMAPDDIRALLERTAVFALPCVVASDGDRDTMPVVVKEALAMEVPVAGTDEVGLPEVIEPGWGRLAPPRDPAGLADALDELLSLTADERAAMGAAGRAFVLEHCSRERETAKLVALIEALRG